MENTLQNRDDTLVSELGNWNRQENRFRELFSDDALKDREFIRMKLERYHSLYYKYRGAERTTDERAMMMVLRFQRRKMERTLYPGLLRRLLHRGRVRLQAALVAGRDAAIAQRTEATQYITPTPVTPVQQTGVRQMKTPGHRTFNRQQQRFRQHRRYGKSI